MIFRRFFGPSHTSKNPQQRLRAIDELNPEKANEKTFLHELAFNDDDSKVSIAALKKLNSFALWQKMAQIAKCPVIKKTAEKQVKDTLLGVSNITLTSKEKEAFVTESANSDLVQQVIEHDAALRQNYELMRALMIKWDKPSFNQYVFLNGSESLQEYMLENTCDESLLQKLEKKARKLPVHSRIVERIETCKALAQQPILVRKDVTLCLSKYQALLDKSDVDHINSSRAELVSEYQSIAEKFDCLEASERDTLINKFERIDGQIERHLARITPEWEAHRAKERLAALLALCHQQHEHAVSQVNWLYNSRLVEATLADVATVNEAVRSVEATIAELHNYQGDESTIASVVNSVVGLVSKLDAFSMQQQYAQKLIVLLEEAEQLAQRFTASLETQDTQDSTDVAPLISAFEAVKKQWKEQLSLLEQVPSTIHSRWKAVNGVFKGYLDAQTQVLNSQVKQCRKLINVVDTLIEKGRYRGALSKFRALQESYSNLPLDAQSKVNKRFESTKANIEKVSGWQAFLVSDKKPSLLEEARALAEQPAEKIDVRAGDIRRLRQQWIQLGDSGNEDNTALNNSFDEALEKAFAPCRAFYAKQDEARNEALQDREKLISTLSSLPNDMPMQKLARELEQLKQQWFNAGHVDKTKYQAVKLAWQEAYKPLQQKVEGWYAENKQQKSKLVAQANALIDSDDTQLATEQAQELQKAWKAIGHAGRRDESQLWGEFKTANDKIFAKLHAFKNAQHSENEALLNALLNKVISVKSQLESEAQVKTASLTALLDEVQVEASALPKVLRNKVSAEVSLVLKAIESAQQNVKDRRLKQRTESLIQLLRTGADRSLSEDISDTLGRRWLNAINGDADSQQTRHWLTVALEAATDMPTPSKDSALRTDVQLSMMTAKLERGEVITADDLFEQWLAHGYVSDTEQGLLERVEQVLSAKPEIVG